MPTELERAAQMLESNGYIVGWIRDSSSGGVVSFFDPHTLTAEWAGPNLFGKVIFSAKELSRLRADANAKAKIFNRVRESELRFLEDIKQHEAEEAKAMSKLAVSLSLVLLCIYPVASLLGQAA